MLSKTIILGVGITDSTEDSILEYVFSFIKDSKKKGYIVTPNPEIVTHAQAHPQFKEILNGAEVALCDGVGISLAAVFLGKHLSGRVTGVSFMESLCKEAVRNGVTVGFLGAKQGVALRVTECLQAKYPELSVVYAAEEWSNEGFVNPGETRNRDIKKLNGIGQNSSVLPKTRVPRPKNIDLLFVAFGFPKQEEWIFKNLPDIPVRMAMSVGGAFDYVSGGTPRAPFIIRSFGMEWLFRLVTQPWRIRRQLKLLSFIQLVVKERFRSI